jgi:hypothetical protein
MASARGVLRRIKLNPAAAARMYEDKRMGLLLVRAENCALLNAAFVERVPAGLAIGAFESGRLGISSQRSGLQQRFQCRSIARPSPRRCLKNRQREPTLSQVDQRL